ncbi:MAG: hypothetical protein AAGF97_07510, partial [Planctomycetota bacterium]
SLQLPPRFDQALEKLQIGAQYAADIRSAPWEFAVHLCELRDAGLDHNDLLWLVRKGIVEQRTEMTLPGDVERSFRGIPCVSFGPRTCFVLTPAGAVSAREAMARDVEVDQASVITDLVHVVENGRNGRQLPSWDQEARKLRFNGFVIKHFRRQALNQEAVLGVFEEESWPERIDDPLPPGPGIDPKRRLADTIKCLNRGQARKLLQFRGDGTGEGVIWEWFELTGADPARDHTPPDSLP